MDKYTVAKIGIHGAKATVLESNDITMGLTGAVVQLIYDDDLWQGMRKKVTFRGTKKVDVLTDENVVELPWEVTTAKNVTVSIGITGVDADEKTIIPTVWATIGAVKDSPYGAYHAPGEPVPPEWAQVVATIGDLNQLNTADKSNLVAAINEAMRNSGGGTGGYYTPVVTQPTANTMQISFTPSVATMPAVEPVTITLPGSGQNVDLAGYAKETWVREGFQPKGDYLANAELATAINTALAQAKASGEFDGADGKDGYTPVKGVDYFDGKDGKPGADGKDYLLTDSDKQEIAELAAPLVDVPAGGGSSGESQWTLIYELITQEELAEINDKTIDESKNEYLLTVLVPAVETQIAYGNNNFFGQRDIRPSNAFAITAGNALHTVYMKKISADEALFISGRAERSEGFNDPWVKTRASKIAYGGYSSDWGLYIQNKVPAGTHIKIYGK